MNNKTIEILIYLLGYLKENNFDDDSLTEFSDHLVGNGYSENEVAEALGLLIEKQSLSTLRPSEVGVQRPTSVRMLNDYERIRIPTAVHGYILKLHSLNIINGSQMERVIEYCLFMDHDGLDEDEINEIVATVLFEESDMAAE